MSDETIKPHPKSDNSLAPALNYIGNKTRLKPTRSCLKQDKMTFTNKTIVNIYIVHELRVSPRGYDDYPTLENCLFGAVKLTKNADTDKYKYSRYDIKFERRGILSFPSTGFGCNIIIFRVNMSSSVHPDNEKEDVLILDEGPKQGLDGTTLTAEKKYSINFTVNRKKFCFLSLHYSRASCYLIDNRTEIHKFKAKDFEIVPIPLYPGKISKDFPAANMEKDRTKWRYLWF